MLVLRKSGRRSVPRVTSSTSACGPGLTGLTNIFRPPACPQPGGRGGGVFRFRTGCSVFGSHFARCVARFARRLLVPIRSDLTSTFPFGGVIWCCRECSKGARAQCLTYRVLSLSPLPRFRLIPSVLIPGRDPRERVSHLGYFSSHARLRITPKHRLSAVVGSTPYLGVGDHES